MGWDSSIQLSVAQALNHLDKAGGVPNPAPYSVFQPRFPHGEEGQRTKKMCPPGAHSPLLDFSISSWDP